MKNMLNLYMIFFLELLAVDPPPTLKKGTRCVLLLGKFLLFIHAMEFSVYWIWVPRGDLLCGRHKELVPGRRWPRPDNDTGLVKAGFTGPEAAIPTWSSRCPDLFRTLLYVYIKRFCSLSYPTSLASSWIT